MQSSTLELINGLVSLLHPPSVADVAMEAMDALLTLHHPDQIEMWNPESPINTFWDVSSQVHFWGVTHYFLAICYWNMFTNQLLFILIYLGTLLSVTEVDFQATSYCELHRHTEVVEKNP